MSCSAIKATGKKEVGGCSELWHLSSQETVMHDGVLLSWKLLNTYLEVGSSE